jgi:hypothetical protein
MRSAPEIVHVSHTEPKVGVQPARESTTDADLGLERHAGHPPVVTEEP